MKGSIKVFFLINLLFAGLLALSENCSAAGPTYISVSTITTPTTWTKADSPYIIKASLLVKANLTIEPGTVIKFNGRANFNIGNSISIKGTEQEKIVFTSFKDDKILGDTNEDGNASSPAISDWNGFSFSDASNVEMENVQISYANVGLFISHIASGSPKSVSIKNSFINNNSMGINLYGSFPVVEGNSIADNNIGIFVKGTNWWGGDAKVRNNSIVDNLEGIRVYNPVLAYYGGVYMDARENWWGDKSGPYYRHAAYGNDNLSGKGNSVSDGVLFDPWTGKDMGCQENCFSNVLFLPGIKSSRLYKNGLAGTEDKLWPPNYFGNDLAQLRLDENGRSLENVYTKDVLDEVAFPEAGSNIYKTFINNLAELKTAGTIDDFGLFAYDWRQNVEDIAKNGTPYPDGVVKSAVAEIITLAQSSKSKKVTIIAHSNGGLVAKAAMLELEKQGLADKVDKIVFVGTPQMGTPLATLSMLYGYDESALFGTLISRSESRTLVENMPGAYGLLPSAEYFKRTENPFIEFASKNTYYKDFWNAYGEKIGNLDEFSSFLIGSGDNREKPGTEDVERENVLNVQLLDEAQRTHERLDAWLPPANVEVVQLAGWGLDTVSGIRYGEKEKFSCTFGRFSFPICKGTGEYEPIYEPEFTVDGDKVVVAPSALMLTEAPNVKRYWVDLWSYDNLVTLGREHKDLFEVIPAQQFLLNIIENKYASTALPENIKNDRPNPEGYDNVKPRLRMSLYSPLDIHLYDDQNRHTGPKKVMIDGQEQVIFEQEIPNSYYYQLGERKFVGFGEGEHVRVELDGYATGAYTLKLEEVGLTANGEESLARATFANLPTTASTKVRFELPQTGLADMTPLQADADGDGKDDYVVKKVLGGTAVLDVTPPEIKIVSPESGKKYLNNQVLKFEYAVADDVSEAKDIQTEVLLDEKPLGDEEIDLSLQNMGRHEFSIEAIDEAGNKAQQKIEFFYVSSIGAISENMDHYVDLKLITDVKVQDFLQVKIKELAHDQDMIAKFDSKNNGSPKANQIRLLDKKIDDLVGFIEGKFSTGIIAPAQEVLIQSLEYIKM